LGKNKRTIALIGLGYWGKNILRNLYEIDVLHTACDSSLETINEHRTKFFDINFTTSIDEVLSNPDIKAVIVATPAITHFKIAKKVILSGKDVLVEKPLALTVKEGEELITIADEQRTILMVGHILLYHPAVQKLKELIISGELGKVQYIYSNRLNIGKFRTEENILWSFAPHDISVILYLIGEEPLFISAMGGDYLNKGIYDITLTNLEFRNGIKGHIFVSWIHPFKEQKLVIVGSKAMAVFDDLSKEKLFLYPHRVEWRNGKIPIAQKADCQTIPVQEEEPLRNELSHFIECITERKKPLTDGKEALEVLKILSLAEDSMKNRKRIKIYNEACHTDISHRCTSPIFIHESSYVDENVTIGKGTKIWHFSHILRNSQIGRDCIIGQNVVVGPNVTIGDRCKIQNNVSIYKGVTLEDDVFCGPSCVFTNVYNPRAFIERKNEFRKTLVKKGATIGANATIICGTTIGRYAFVGAGAVVKSDIPDYGIAVGVPTRIIGWACKCGTTLKFNKGYAICDYCKNEYRLNNGSLEIVIEND